MKIAVTGTIGSGKSTVCAYLKELGYDVFDCDEVNRDLLEPEREDEPLFAEVPLLFEAGWDPYFDLKILVVTDEETAFQRLKERGLSCEEIRNRLAAQMPVSEKMKRADKIIYNNDSLSKLYRIIDELLKEIL